MPDRDVHTIKELIYYQYAKVIAKSALGSDAKKKSYGFIKKTFKDLVNSEKNMVGYYKGRQTIYSERKEMYILQFYL
jgi:hypothetical protein